MRCSNKAGLYHLQVEETFGNLHDMPKYCISSGYSHIQTAIKPQKHRKRKHQDCTEEHGSWGRVDSWKRLLLPRYSAEKAGGLVDFWGSLEIPCFSLFFKWKQWGFTSLPCWTREKSSSTCELFQWKWPILMFVSFLFLLWSRTSWTSINHGGSSTKR